MYVNYFYCSSCGYECFEVFVAYSRTCAGGDLCLCPSCNKESSHIEI